MSLKPGDYVMWKWAGSVAHGEIVEVHEKRVQIESKGKLITRNGTLENPAVIIKHKSGNQVLKLASELQKAKDN